MSCWRTYQCDTLKNVNKNWIIEALKELGVNVDQNKKIVHGSYENRSAQVDGVFSYDGKNTDLGIIFNGKNNKVEVIGDFWGSGLDSMTFVDDLARQYLKIQTENQLRMAGYVVQDVTTDANGDIVMEAVAYA